LVNNNNGDNNNSKNNNNNDSNSNNNNNDSDRNSDNNNDNNKNIQQKQQDVLANARGMYGRTRLVYFRQHSRDMTYTSRLRWKLPSKQGCNRPQQPWDGYW